MNKLSIKRKLRYGSMTILLTVLVIAAVVILNVIAGALCLRYEWMYLELAKPPVYDISEECENYLKEYVISEIDKVNAESGEKQTVKIIFCDTEENITSEDLYRYIHDSFYDVQEMFPGYFEISYLDIWERPGEAASYGVTSSEDVVCVFNGQHQTMTLKDFYITETQNYSSVAVAYNGEKILASCLMRVTQAETPMCYLTVNHGEAFDDFEFIRMMAESGYTVGFLDLYNQEIPEDCDILVTFNPKKDFSESDANNSVSESEKIGKWMDKGGKYMIFLSSDTFASGGFTNMEGFLASWGVKYMHKTTGEGIEACYLVRDDSNSLTTDGYTILAESANRGFGAKALGGLSAENAFPSTTIIKVADGFSADGKGNYISGTGITLSPLFTSHSSAIAWADGKAVERASNEPFILMSMSEKQNADGSVGYLVASASVEFASEDSMRSSVLGNSRALTQMIRYMGKENAPGDLVFKPFGETEIQSLTAKNANIISAILIFAPAITVSVIGAVVLIRRRNR